PSLELQSCFTRRVGDRFDAPVIDVSAAVENDFGHALRLGRLGDLLADFLGSGEVPAGLLRALLAFVGAGSGDGLAFHVVDELDIDVLGRTVDVQTRALGRANQLDADAAVDLQAFIVLRNLRNHLLLVSCSRSPSATWRCKAGVLLASSLISLRSCRPSSSGA